MLTMLPTISAAAIATAITLPFVRKALIVKGVLDRPTSRSSHSVPTPRGGGLGVMAGVAAAVAISLTTEQLGVSVVVLAIGAAIILLALTGFCDDLGGLAPTPRILLQSLAGFGVGAAASAGTSPLMIGVLGLGSSMLMIYVVNVINFMDGINGITAATMASWGAVTLWTGVAETVPVASVAGATALGTGLAFLPFNAPKAKLFLGDSGSYLYGAIVSSTAVVMITSDVSPWIVAAPLVPYAADVNATLLRRARRGAQLSQAHREHFYQQLTSSEGWSHARVSLLYGGLSLTCGAIAIRVSEAATSALLIGVALGIALGPSFISRQVRKGDGP